MKGKTDVLKILIADDHSVVRAGIIRALTTSFNGVEIGEASNAQEVMKLLTDSYWNVIVLDVSMPGRSGLELISDIVANYSSKVIIFSMYPEDQFAVRAIKAGASAYITKDTPLRDLMEAISKISHGERFLTPSVADLLANELYAGKNNKPLHEVLSDREFQVFQSIASGKPVSLIANELSLSVKTVSVYRAKILKKMNLRNNAEITHYAFKHSLVE